MISDPEAASLAQLVVYAMDAYLADKANLAPPPDPRLSPRWRVLGYLTATDALLRTGEALSFGENTVCYGYLAQEVARPSVFVAALRGTDGVLEWVEDAQFAPVAHPLGGHAEAGFWGIYRSLTLQTPAGSPVAAAAGISARVGSGQLIVLGHSLGSALATYLALDCARMLGPRAQLVAFASPRPGDAAFAAAFARQVTTSVVYNYELDVVPRVPRGFGFTDLSSVHWIGIQAAQARIRFDLSCHHHLLCYCAMLDYALLDWHAVPVCDQANAACIQGPHPP